MAYYVTPDLGLELADPLTIQAFETVNVNDNFLTLEAGIVADRVRLSAAEPKITALEARVTQRPVDLDALAAVGTGSLLSGDLARVTEGGALFFWAGTAWEQLSVAKFASTAARDTAYAKASAAYRVTGARSRVTTEGFVRVYGPTLTWVPDGFQQLPVKPTGVVGGTESLGIVTVTAAATAVRLDGIFNAAHGFPRYRIGFDLITSAAAGLNIRLAAGGVVATTAYDNQRDTSINASIATTPTSSVGEFQGVPFGIAGGNARGTVVLENPHLAAPTRFLSDFTVMDASYSAASGSGRTNGRHRTATAYDGINFSPPSGNLTSGTITVEGLSS